MHASLIDHDHPMNCFPDIARRSVSDQILHNYSGQNHRLQQKCDDILTG